jgi:hypothetical protein
MKKIRDPDMCERIFQDIKTDGLKDVFNPVDYKTFHRNRYKK